MVKIEYLWIGSIASATEMIYSRKEQTNQSFLVQIRKTKALQILFTHRIPNITFSMFEDKASGDRLVLQLYF